MASAKEVLCTVTSLKYITPTVFELCFTAEPNLPFEAGQFISVIIPGAGPKGRDLRRAYSVASEPERGHFELCVKLVPGGPGTTYLSKLTAGATFKGVFPYGDFVFRNIPGKHACFISTGTGIAPFRSMILSKSYKDSRPASALCLLGVRETEEVIYTELGKEPGIKWVSTVSKPNETYNGFKGRVTDYLRTLGPEYPWLETHFYLCGNGAMITEVKQILAEKGVTKEAIHQEKYY